MKILVCISKAPDTTSKIAFTDNQTKFDEAGVQFIINPYDEWYALVKALEIKESASGTVSVISVGSADYDASIRKALAIGADDAVRIDTAGSDALYIAKQIAAYAKGKDFDLILCGRETIDYNGAAVPGMLAELLDLPYIALVSQLDVSGSQATAKREVSGGGTEVIEVTLPAVMSATEGLAEQRIPNMRGIMGAKSKPLTVVAPVEATAATAIRQYALPPAKGSVKLIPAENAGDLIRLLHEEAKVI